MTEKEFKLTENGKEEINEEVKEVKDILNKITETPENKKGFEELPKPKDYYPEKEKEIQEIPNQEIPKEYKKEKVKELNKEIGSNPITKDYTLISKANLIGIWVLIGVLILFLMIGIIWSNSTKSSFNKIFKDKNFGDTNNINVEPANVSVPVNISDKNIYYNNFTIVNNNTIIVPGEFANYTKSMQEFIDIIKQSMNSS